jgi:hypothetical protein
MIRFEYRLIGAGWSEATLSDRETAAEITASYLSDALGDLARGVILLLHGREDVTVSWKEEPGEYRWRFTLTGDRLTVRILWFDSPYSTLPDDRGRPVFQTACRLVDFAGQVTSQLRTLLETLGEAEYKRHWVSHDFPRAEYETLVRLGRKRRLHPA